MPNEDFYMHKSLCESKDWSNTKDITQEELAWCINEYDLDINNVPESRRTAVTKLLIKLQKQKEDKVAHEQELKLIREELSINRNINDGSLLEKIAGGEPTGYYRLEPTLFKTYWEAMEAMVILRSMTTGERHNVNPYKNNNHSRDIGRLDDDIVSLRQKYIKLGVSSEEFDKHISQIPIPKLPTLKQDIDSQRKYITDYFISLGVPKTRAKQIAIAITTEVYKELN